MFNTVSVPQSSIGNKATQDAAKAIAFKVLDKWFALPIEAVLRIVPCPPLDAPIKNCLGLAEWDRQNITVIDLAQKLQPESSEIAKIQTTDRSFLILTQTQSAELCGFLTRNSPVLLNIPLASIRAIPASYRQVAELNVVSKMSVITTNESTEALKILLLGSWDRV